MFSFSLILLSLLPHALGCADHMNHIAPLHNQRRQLTTNRTGRPESYWTYDASYDWAKLNPDWAMCQMGTQQSPIALTLNQGLSSYHHPGNWTGYENVTGEAYNWGHGPAQTLYHPVGDYTNLPSFTFDNETVYMTGWHVHSPADHSVGGDRSKSELHLVHYNAAGKPRAVIAIRVDPGASDSKFFSQLHEPLIGFNDTNRFENFNMNIMPALEQVAMLNEFWTYKGSLTSPPCEEGIRFFIARQVLFVGVKQMQSILRVSTYSARAEQEVWLHEINV